MHPGPMNRGVEIAPDVADCGQTLIPDQVRSGLAVRMALLYDLARTGPRRRREARRGGGRQRQPQPRWPDGRLSSADAPPPTS